MLMAAPTTLWAAAPDRGQQQAALIFQILASEIALSQGEVGVAALTYLNVAKQTQDPTAARRATELAIEARSPQRAEEAAQIWLANAPNDQEAQNTLDLLQLVQGETQKLIRSLSTRRLTASKENKAELFYDYLAALRAVHPTNSKASSSSKPSLIPTAINPMWSTPGQCLMSAQADTP